MTDHAYLMARMLASLEMASKAASSAARLIHLDLAGRYSLAVGEQVARAAKAPSERHRPGATSFYVPDAGRADGETRRMQTL